jgi:hypothetical protein
MAFECNQQVQVEGGDIHAMKILASPIGADRLPGVNDLRTNKGLVARDDGPAADAHNFAHHQRRRADQGAMAMTVNQQVPGRRIPN